jgi:hypothetical protein
MTWRQCMHDCGCDARAGFDATRAGNRKRPLDGSFSDSSPKRRLCPSPQGLLTIQIPPADDGPGTTGIPSALKSMATLTAAELQVRVNKNPPSARKRRWDFKEEIYGILTGNEQHGWEEC